MRRNSELVAAVAIFILTSGFQSRTPVLLRADRTVSISTNENVRRTFEAIAQRAGFRVVFAPRVIPAGTPFTFSVDNMRVADALDLLSSQTQTFWTVWDKSTILVAPDDAANRREYDRQFIAVASMRRGFVEEDVKRLLAASTTSTVVGDKVVIRDNPGAIEKTIESIGRLDGSKPHIVFLPSAANLFLTEAGSGSRSTTSQRSQLLFPSLRLPIFSMSANIATIYANMAGQGGINVAFGRVFPQRPATLRVENLNILDALDLLAIGTGSFWQPMNENTVAVYDGTRENRRDFALQEMEIVYLSEGTTMQRLDDLTNALRTVLGMQGVHSYEPRKALLLRDTSSNILLGEDLIAALEGTPTLSRVVVADLNGGASQVVSLRAAPATRSWLKLRIAALPFKEGGDIRNIYEFIAQSAGISVVFAPKFPARRVEFQFNGLEVIDLLDIVAHQTGTFWQTIDERTILVAEDTQQNRRDYEVQVLKTILLPVRTTPEEMNKLTNILRTALNPRSMYDSATVKAIVLRDTPSTVELMEKIVRQLIPDPTAVVITVPAPGLAEGRFLGNAAVAGSQLELRPTGAISAQVLQDSRVSYETLAELGGIKVSFDPRFNPGFPMTLRLQAMDIPHALDQLSLQTGNYWTVLDRWTIFVAPDTPEVRRQIDPPVSRTVSLKTVAPDAAGEIVTILRTILSMAEVESNGASSIVMRDTPNRIAVAEQMITNLDRP